MFWHDLTLDPIKSLDKDKKVKAEISNGLVFFLKKPVALEIM